MEKMQLIRAIREIDPQLLMVLSRTDLQQIWRAKQAGQNLRAILGV